MPPDWELLRLAESNDQIGFWIWCFGSDDQYWSPGSLRLLGRDVGSMRMSYPILLGSIHPDDRPFMPSPDELSEGGPDMPQTIRVIRPDGTKRVLSSRIELRVDADGRTMAAWGTLLDVTERDRLARSRVGEIRRLRALDRCLETLRFLVRSDLSFDFVPEAAEVVGLPLSQINADPFSLFVPEQRSAIRQAVSHHKSSGDSLVRDVRLNVPTSGSRAGRLVMMPFQDDRRGEAPTWGGLLQIRDHSDPELGEVPAERIGALCTGRDFSAARALLDWSMHRLAAVSEVSISTVRRVEQQGGGLRRSRAKLVTALERGGVRFFPLAEGSVAISHPKGGRS